MGGPDAVRDLDTLTSWHADWSGLRVGVLGLGVTGFAVADTLTELGAKVLVVAESGDPDQINLLDVIGAGWLAADLSAPPAGLVEHAPELLVVSPGFHPDHPVLLWAAEQGIPVWGDIELAWRLRDKTGTPAEWIAITGTNGKTTTTQLTAAMLEAGGARVTACGNIGVPVLDAIRDPAGFDALVVELSSYQLHYANGLSPYASVVLNVAHDHLDWHGSFEAYRASKGKVYANTKVACVYNLEDDTTRELVEEADVVEGCRAIGFGPGVPGPSDIGIVEDIVCDRAFLEQRQTSALEIATLADLATVNLSAPHLVADVLAATALARAWGVKPRVIRDALLAFHVDKHRTQTVARGDVHWVDDSKATNPHAADASLGAFDSVVWIVGGLLKGVDIAPLVEKHAERLRAAVVIGVEREPVLAAFERHAPQVRVVEVDAADTGEVMPSAVRLAGEVARPGDVVLLAPAAASMDQFVSYSDRGDRFARAVRELVADDEGGSGRDDDSAQPPSAQTD
ncbi:UDP-N-acetylmuramoyl-L-alanine--D-glutamate ligase [Desertivibrio insolitus]|uniref:UDP-N-acetylmuramoyl-L-alanine--D-glutamate ligase n=1 Tax=Herbiconiux sp. SYSU D00978 TaxID=2812562 RepID=UPI001A964D6B|nr:UDP-N-acetylmuramoyl-L-alanine--D-glutamate ligase [Herbiconiux sp. SYSU D00978]